METKFLKEALFKGKTANAVKTGTILNLGRFWLRNAGCHIVYRGQDGKMDYEKIQAVMNLDSSQVSLANQALPANTIWHYIRRQVSCCGLESPDSPACIVGIDSNGDMIGNAPNPPLDLVIRNMAGGKLKLRWRYTPIAEVVTPTGFNIYMDSGSGFAFNTPEDAVSYNLGGNGEFEWTSDALADGQRYRFCVRSYCETGGESQNTNFIAAIADAQGPDAIAGLRASWSEN